MTTRVELARQVRNRRRKIISDLAATGLLSLTFGFFFPALIASIMHALAV